MSTALPIRIAAAAAALTALTACSPAANGQPPVAAPSVTIVAPPPTQPPTTQPPTTQPPRSESSSTAPPPPSPTGSQPTTAPGDEQPVAVRDGSIDRIPVRGSLYEIHRSGTTVAVNVMIKAVNPDDQFMIADSLSDGNNEVSATGPAVDGIRMIDARNKKAYLPATTLDGQCLCTPARDAVYLNHNQIWVSVVFAAPPANVTAVDILVPLFGTVHDVPVH